MKTKYGKIRDIKRGFVSLILIWRDLLISANFCQPENGIHQKERKKKRNRERKKRKEKEYERMDEKKIKKRRGSAKAEDDGGR